MRYVPVYVAVDTDDNREALDCASAVVEGSRGEAWELRMPDAGRVTEVEGTVLSLCQPEGYDG